MYSKTNKMEKRTSSQVIEDLRNIPYEVSFSRESVIEILENIKCPEPQKPQGKVDYDKILKDVTELVINGLEGMRFDDLVSNPSFSLYGNEIQLEHCDIDKREVRNTISQVLVDYFEELKEEQVVNE